MDQLGNKPPSSSTKVERRVIEKSRRNHMKMLYSKLNSLLPNYNPKLLQEALPLIDQVDEAIKYIKILEGKVKMAQEKKESLGEKKRSRSCCSSSSATTSCPKSPQLEVHEMGSCLELVLTCGLETRFIFYEIIRILHEENIEVKTSANSSLAGDSMLHVVHAEIPQSYLQFGVTKVSERLKKFVNVSSSDMKIPLDWRDFEIDTNLWGF
ncbi:transcription factor bHLH162-like [Gastrolobium bilobum]|uniref:transcription factor bHLH162-like n=1 Tax=Gastrolobium bilobum TaxID=150636 RepID=UPI002AB093EF|nr:transcription factor bHLH162-like [Gastrolobium bilobum]